MDAERGEQGDGGGSDSTARAGAIVDKSAPPRPGEELPVEALEPLLLAELGGEGPLVVEQFPSGHSNLTYLLRLGGRQYVLRRPPFGAHAAGGHDMSREYRILEKLHAVFPHAPRPVLFVDDPAVMGADFYVMERITGVILRREPPAGLDLSPSVMRRLSENFVDELAVVHQLDWEAAGLGELRRPGSYVERQVRGWATRWLDSKTDELPLMDELAAWLEKEMPPDSGAALVHGDFKFDNLVLGSSDVTRVVGVLDWEMATIGDPLMDLGCTLGYWVEPGDSPALVAGKFGPTTLPGSFTRDEVVARYAHQVGAEVGDVDFYYVYALFKLAVIVQQIYYRYAMGFTTDDRFAAFRHMVGFLAQAAADVVERRS